MGQYDMDEGYNPDSTPLLGSSSSSHGSEPPAYPPPLDKSTPADAVRADQPAPQAGMSTTAAVSNADLLDVNANRGHFHLDMCWGALTIRLNCWIPNQLCFNNWCNCGG
ncbi:hypothetical protein CI109_102853 [Kwoniella shandongensis]|uniref:Uncharacterized protein n=1 Tax=Kwoniella shandongensis TaxID=1734106 RepID=A0A5M6C810_9TREE|nr:uncharacterized protein CI109_000042 [Kwoniella shandongensis]KAA5531204.1 hypothetical protein CI109_000042 [Kwoniella shandongensis]